MLQKKRREYNSPSENKGRKVLKIKLRVTYDQNNAMEELILIHST